ncbi:ABC transporter A family member 2-like [Humulus lupulus]|uniref:ABC transporter A family member 2-like n=1 Tax=Humulus lupulus TaxID=3486 RepID=UPI002B415DA6|nr:ABC transporter A family member 2-like [Humulus lupulus]
MKLQCGFPLLLQQFKALFKKNVLLSWRNKRATFIQLFASFFFIFLMFCIQISINIRMSHSTFFKHLADPRPLNSPPIPPCEDNFYVKLPCYDFVWSGNGSARIRRIMSAIMANNPGRPIPSIKVKSFRTAVEVDEWLYRNPMYCYGALHFMERNSSVISYGIQTNSTLLPKRGKFEDPTFKFLIPLHIAAEREISRSLIGVQNYSWAFGFKEFPHPPRNILLGMNTAGSPFSMSTVGPPFFLAVVMFGFVFQMTSLVTEKELKLRQAMTLMGLYDSAYWFSWLVWEGILTFISSLLIVLFGMLFQLDFFLNNSSIVLFFLFFLFQLNMLGFAFMLSTFLSKSTSCTVTGFSIYIAGSSIQFVGVFGFPYMSKFSQLCQIIWSFFPPNLLAKALWLLSDATSSPEDVGISWSGRAMCTPNDEYCVITINDIYNWLLVTFFLWCALAVYFDNIFPNDSGMRKSVFYFLKPAYWIGTGASKVEESDICSCLDSIPQDNHIHPDNEGVLEEENIIKEQIIKGVDNPNIVVQIRGLVKTYHGTTKAGCFKCKKTSPYHALKGIWLNFAKDQIFCLLGMNRAGKTTTFNCLTGITPVTSGDALVYGHSIRSSIGMSKIQKLMGVCPQFDIQWDALSGLDHLHLFAKIKGLPPSSIDSVVERSLAEVRLTKEATVRVGSYSGGMKRRLSVAVALIGDPKLVILDEPTTGMDPIARRHVWDIIKNAKKGRAIVLTTHSMEEAEILSDRIGIMANGRLRCIGTSVRLKSRFGTGFIVNINFNRQIQTPRKDVALSTHDLEAVKQFFKHHLDVCPKEEKKSLLTFSIPHDKETILPDFLTELQDRESKFGITDIQIGLTPLEEVFMNITRQAELENAMTEGRFVTLNLTTSGTSVEIPVGARFVGIPGTESEENSKGIMVEVFWEQDDFGELCISGHSDETPIPHNIESLIPIIAKCSSRKMPGRGVVLDHNMIFNKNFQQ